jgi:hypothetical protein
MKSSHPSLLSDQQGLVALLHLYPDYDPYAQKYGLYEGEWGGYRPALEAPGRHIFEGERLSKPSMTW